MTKELIVGGKDLGGNIHSIVTIPPVGEDAVCCGQDGATFLFEEVGDLDL
jgi:hypothetical protein